jgi:small-conductance mechanosensitive channel
MENVDNIEPLEKQFRYNWQLLQEALVRPGFYMELGMIAAALVVAIVLSAIVRKQLSNRLRNHPPRYFDADFFIRPLILLTPVFVLILLGAIRPLAVDYTGGDEFVTAAASLTVAYALARAALLFVKSRLIAYLISFVILVATVFEVTGFAQSTKAYLTAMNFEIGKFKLSILNLVNGLIILILVFWIAGLLSRTLESYLRRSSNLNYAARELMVKFCKLFFFFCAFLITLSTLGVDLTSFAVFGGALGVGIGLGLQRLTANFLSGVTLLLEKSIKIGDMIDVGGNVGYVRMMQMRYTLVEMLDGRGVLVPNEELLTSRVINWTYGDDKVRIEIKIPLSFSSDVNKARDLMVEAAKGNQKVMTDPAPIVDMADLTSDGPLLSLLFWVSNIKKGNPRSAILYTIYDKFRAAGIQVAAVRQEAVELGGTAIAAKQRGIKPAEPQPAHNESDF